MDWITERYTWSGIVYSSTLDPTLDLRGFMSVEKGTIAPDLVVYMDTPPSRVVGQHSASSLFDDAEFQQALYDLYAQPSLWAGIQVIQHATRENKWESCKALSHSLVKEGRVTTLSKT